MHLFVACIHWFVALFSHGCLTLPAMRLPIDAFFGATTLLAEIPLRPLRLLAFGAKLWAVRSSVQAPIRQAVHHGHQLLLIFLFNGHFCKDAQFMMLALHSCSIFGPFTRFAVRPGALLCHWAALPQTELRHVQSLAANCALLFFIAWGAVDPHLWSLCGPLTLVQFFLLVN